MDDEPVQPGEKEEISEPVKHVKKKAKQVSKAHKEEHKEHPDVSEEHKKEEQVHHEHEVKNEEPAVHVESPAETLSDDGSLWGSIGTWRFLVLVFVVLFIASIFTSGFAFNSRTELSPAEATAKTVSFVNAVQPGLGAFAQATTDEGDLYKIKLSVQGQTFDSYITKDGRLLFPEGIDLNQPAPEVDLGPQDLARVDVSADDDPSKGSANAPVTIIEFSDFQCPFCERFYTDTLPQLEEKYIKTGKVKLVYRDFPLENIHPEARPAAHAAESADEQGKFWEFHDKLFENQASLGASNYKKWAEELGLDMKKFNDCVDTEKYAGEVSKDLADGSAVGVSGTPAFFVNGKLLSGAQPFSAFQAAIEAELAAMSEPAGTDEITVAADEPEPTVVGGSGVKKVAIEAKKFRFTPSAITVVKGTIVDLEIKSVDVDFSFVLPELNIQLDLKPGETSVAQFAATKVGEYEFSCGRCNGKETVMKGKITVE
jgi:protein-disulfide isomerase/plastocyanin